MRHESYPQVLLLASRYDLSCDFITSRLKNKNVNYLRLNSEDLQDFHITLDPVRKILEIDVESSKYVITPDNLRSVFFRRPVFLREYGDDYRPPTERFSRIQWAAFLRNLMLFDEATWVNSPVATYRAEHKALQLSIAAQLGFPIPETCITNSPYPYSLGHNPCRVAIKGLDTVLIRAEGQEIFGFTTFEDSSSLEPVSWQAAPATIQKALIHKLDIRASIIGDRVLAASITSRGKPISGDWRVQKSEATFSRVELPEVVEERCCKLVRKLGLIFGAIDLAFCNDKFYFLEINPTGEWAWLVDTAKLPVDDALVDCLTQEI